MLNNNGTVNTDMLKQFSDTKSFSMAFSKMDTDARIRFLKTILAIKVRLNVIRNYKKIYDMETGIHWFYSLSALLLTLLLYFLAKIYIHLI